MKIFNNQKELKTFLANIETSLSTGFVPTMGALHGGHLKLISESKKECDITICSIFINPTQFNSNTDLENYPKTIGDDLEQLEKTHCDIVYIPKTNDLYAKNEKAKEFDFGTLSNTMEGKFRKGHFNGMATVVEKFFNIIKPTKAFFGNKDLQQLQIVKALVKQMDSDITIIGVPTIREKSGLAKSSRNIRLSKDAIKEASLINSTLNYCKNNKNDGVSVLKEYIKGEFLNSKLELEYAELVSLENMENITDWGPSNQNAICIAANIDGVRLIDNIIL